MRIGSEAPKRRAHSLLRRDKPWSPTGHHHLEPSSATRHKRTGLGRNCWGPSASSGQCVGRRMTPSGSTPSRTSRHREIRSLRAKATIMVCECPERSRVGSETPHQGVVLLEHANSRHPFWAQGTRAVKAEETQAGGTTATARAPSGAAAGLFVGLYLRAPDILPPSILSMMQMAPVR